MLMVREGSSAPANELPPRKRVAVSGRNDTPTPTTAAQEQSRADKGSSLDELYSSLDHAASVPNSLDDARQPALPSSFLTGSGLDHIGFGCRNDVVDLATDSGHGQSTPGCDRSASDYDVSTSDRDLRASSCRVRYPRLRVRTYAHPLARTHACSHARTHTRTAEARSSHGAVYSSPRTRPTSTRASHSSTVASSRTTMARHTAVPSSS